MILLVAVAVAGWSAASPATCSTGWSSATEHCWLVELLTSCSASPPTCCCSSPCSCCSPSRDRRAGSLWAGAVLGAIAFEVLKQALELLLKSTQGNPAFQAFGIALILLVWINYFSRVVLYAAAFAHTSPAARALRAPEPAEAPCRARRRRRSGAEDEQPAWVRRTSPAR